MTTRRLFRSTSDRKLAGVAGGLAVYFDLDPTLVRVALVVAALMGWGLVLYLVMWIVVPQEGDVPAAPRSSRALSIAEERYARGEITEDELDRIRRNLG